MRADSNHAAARCPGRPPEGARRRGRPTRAGAASSAGLAGAGACPAAAPAARGTRAAGHARG
ncbi:hypothetical protein [Sorangium sp. So ce385]|uniref:hypothetical protein n=1 Tax=Sorangium sp. So ce385 TaxID=3133308 RepID=UPI003F5CB973